MTALRFLGTWAKFWWLSIHLKTGVYMKRLDMSMGHCDTELKTKRHHYLESRALRVGLAWLVQWHLWRLVLATTIKARVVVGFCYLLSWANFSPEHKVFQSLLVSWLDSGYQDGEGSLVSIWNTEYRTQPPYACWFTHKAWAWTLIVKILTVFAYEWIILLRFIAVLRKNWHKS